MTFGSIDPSKMNPETIGRLTLLMQKLPPEKISEMQTLMHNMMAGFDVTASMKAFEESLPEDFVRDLRTLTAREGYLQAGVNPEELGVESASATPESLPEDPVVSARLTLLRGVRDGEVTPEDAMIALFGSQ